MPHSSNAPRYAWVLAGRHDAPQPGAPPGPRAEFEVFLARHGGALLSRSSLDGDVPPLPRLLARAGLHSLALAQLVQSRAGSLDAIIASGEDIGLPITLASLPRLRRVPIHMMFHGHHLDSPKLRLAAPMLRRMGHVHFHCLSQALKLRTQQVLGIPEARCHATGYGVDTFYFSGGEPDEAAMIASAGAANRDYASLAAAVSDLPVMLCIAADSTWVPPGAPAGPMHWPANVTARSYGSYAHLRDLYARARFVVVPLHPARHACGYAVIGEALAMGCAVIATRTDVPPDFLHAGITGLYVDAHDIAGLRAAICRLLDNPGEAAAMGRRARAMMVAGHSLEPFCDRLERIVAASIATRAATDGHDVALHRHINLAGD